MVLLFDEKLLKLLAPLAIILITCYLYVQYYIYNYWNRRGVKTIPPTFLWGNMKSVFMMKQWYGGRIKEIYNSTKEPFVGMFSLLSPTLLVCDPELCRRIVIDDFQNFHDHGLSVNEKHDPLSAHLFSLGGEKWKNMRIKLTPTFTSGKLKMMFQTLVDCGDSLPSYLRESAETKSYVDVRDLSTRYTTNAIASCAFGIDVDCIKEPDHIFRQMGRKSTELTCAIKLIINLSAPKLAKTLRLKIFDKYLEDFIFSLIKQTIEHREKNNIQRKDFMQLLLQLRNTGKVGNDNDLNIESADGTKSLTLEQLAAQVFIFFLAGFETSSTAMSFCLYELARNPDIQRKLQNEISTILKKYDGKLTYDAIMEMKYLDNCVDESLRKYPPAPILLRMCTKEYKIPGTDVVIEKGTSVIIPSLALQNDPKYYPDPDTFNPERFNNQSTGSTAKQFTYMPFGDGPRSCIGLRFGKMQTKTGLAIMLSKFNFAIPPENIDKAITMDPKVFLLCPLEGIKLKVSIKNE